MITLRGGGQWIQDDLYCKTKAEILQLLLI